MIADLTFVPYVEYNLSIIEKSIANAPPSEQIWVARYALIPGWEGKGLMGAAMKAIWWWTEEVNRIAGLCGVRCLFSACLEVSHHRGISGLRICSIRIQWSCVQ